MQQRFLTWIGAVSCALLLTAQANAFGGKHREIDWDDELNLTEAQEDRIDDIEDRYHDQMRELRRAGGDRADKQDKFEQLQRAMRDEIHAVLTVEQREEARALMREQHSRMRQKYARHLARELDLSDEQQSQLVSTVKALPDDYQWPMDKAQRDAARDQFDAAVESVLTEEQSQQWQKMKERQQSRWHHPGEPGWGAPDDDDDDGRKGGKGC